MVLAGSQSLEPQTGMASRFVSPCWAWFSMAAAGVAHRLCLRGRLTCPERFRVQTELHGPWTGALSERKGPASGPQATPHTGPGLCSHASVWGCAGPDPAAFLPGDVRSLREQPGVWLTAVRPASEASAKPLRPRSSCRTRRAQARPSRHRRGRPRGLGQRSPEEKQVPAFPPAPPHNSASAVFHVAPAGP